MTLDKPWWVMRDSGRGYELLIRCDTENDALVRMKHAIEARDEGRTGPNQKFCIVHMDVRHSELDPANANAGTNRAGKEVRKGSWVKASDGRTGVVTCVLQDGDADIKWDDGSFGTVKWFNVEVLA